MAKEKKLRKNCTQVTIPEVDNSSPCYDFMLAECVIVDENFSFTKNIPGDNLAEFLEKQNNELLKLRNTIALLVKKMDALQECCNGSTGIGTFEP